MSLRIGTSGWSYPGGRGTWNGVFYPAKEARPRGFDELEFYARWFDVVEVNSTFYGQPRASVTRRWAERTPATFEFAVKLFQKFTHPSMFLEAVAASAPGTPEAALAAAGDVRRADVDEFKAGIEPLAEAGKLGAVLVQFPPSFTASAEGVDYLGWLLRTFGDYAVAVELRHKSWSDSAEDTAALLTAYGAAWVLIDEPKFRFSIRQNWTAAPAEGPESGLAYVRFHGRNAAEWWRHAAAEDRYNYLYSAAELAPMGQAVSTMAAQAKKAYLFFNNHFSAQGVANAVQLRRQLGDPPPEPLPPALLARFPWLDGPPRA
ncbi:MAG: DUF72 domain-containing protein [Vicinamibacterales bacterium]